MLRAFLKNIHRLDTVILNIIRYRLLSSVLNQDYDVILAGAPILEFLDQST